ncbi:class I SAM-dependent methyltransferase [Ktedonosporobacter rubrisoli]|uniref:Class I SAM-dependent methyltransferase n=1 Tax=Ktedonosporobacter rubrisoli TaxID=2509675 RepID=A0A4P6JY25_KTERU|nr:class I SAM-dependent methyltransferase [Ktedonosporobacter rubrisoli]QBD80687.1 class I SAM-dependent methyltransferase [Ktedonosporobacter rubrisoli]
MLYELGEYYERVDDYDLEYQSQSELDVPFWRELVMRYTPQRVLELACGSGRIGLELLHSPGDFKLDGLDIEPAMLKAYQRKLQSEPIATQQRVTLHEANMVNYNLPHKGDYDLILLPFNSIAHLYEIEQQLDAFKNTYDHLMPGGRFVVDTFLPDIDYLSNALNRPSNVYLEDEIEDSNQEFTMLLYTSRKYDTFEQLQHIVWTHEKFFETGENERYLTRLDMHVFFPRELQLLFLAAGFRIEAIYGSYDWKPFGKGTRQIVVGRKAGLTLV